jgi:hypothetical protein
MTITTPIIQLSSEGSAIYMLHWGEYEDKATYGPYLGATGLDFEALAEEYRRDRYAAAEAAQEDYCSLDEGNFTAWLVAKGILAPIQTADIVVQIGTSFDNAYVPKHWPECPECGEGRGEQEYGEVRRSLNRVMSFRRCTECRHEWDHVEVANNSRLPMLDDDGRDTAGGCVPFAIGKACGIDWATVKDVCTKYGWSTTDGMRTPHNAMLAAKELGHELVSHDVLRKGLSQPTLKQVTSQLAGGGNYIIGLRGHWLALVNGQLVDNDNNSGMTSRVIEVFEVRKVQAIAA